MEISPVFGKPIIILTRPSPIISSSPSSSPYLPSRPTKNPNFTSATITTTSHLNVSTKFSKRNSVTHKARQSAIIQIQQSSDLDSALSRFFSHLSLPFLVNFTAFDDSFSLVCIVLVLTPRIYFILYINSLILSWNAMWTVQAMELVCNPNYSTCESLMKIWYWSWILNDLLEFRL